MTNNNHEKEIGFQNTILGNVTSARSNFANVIKNHLWRTCSWTGYRRL